MEDSLYRAALSGNVAALDALLQEDELILDRASLTCFHETPLHIATMRGHLHFAASLLNRRPKLSMEFDALHRLPIHLAAIEGHAELVAQLLYCDPESIEQRLYRGETTLHLCVRYNQLEAPKYLVKGSNNEEFVNIQDDDGNTILHLATFLKQMETLRCLLSVPIIKAGVNALNRMGFTALDLLVYGPRDFKSLEIRDILMKAVTCRVEDPNINTTVRIQSPLLSIVSGNSETKPVKPSWFTQLCRTCNKFLKHQGDWVAEMQGSLMLVATLTATISFQVAFSPPGGVWGSTKTKHKEPDCSVGLNGV
ncbi:ankyrin repeat-containing protein ITN1-like [Durio zibethinus]|uniref:Ankyrin repeat-containing protein ITN1-like n=1 Tax=Durio zibethinus TaxID=66656 RepID=A0A6P5WF99_DURZI|nr:ankyrin repeat-containing protein ITN1-like [Durio zibethinus]